MRVSILGTRGIPAQHGGFETFAEHLALYLQKSGHAVTVYCQSAVRKPLCEDEWNGVRRVTIYGAPTPVGTIQFDFRAALHAAREPGVILTLGYNTGFLSAIYRLAGLSSVMNMDGLEWKREKWSLPGRLWLRLNERLGAGLSNHLIADHPVIGSYLREFSRDEKITVVPYECEPITAADPTLLAQLALTPRGYATVIARPEPENSLLEIVQAFSQKRRGIKLLVLGNYAPDAKWYHRSVIEAAGEEVIFGGAIYDPALVKSLRYHSRAYLHGHRVGGTNPSLVESLAAGNPVIAHDNPFTRWVAGPEQLYFSNTLDLSRALDLVLDDETTLSRMSAASRLRHETTFMPYRVLPIYEEILLRHSVAPHPVGIKVQGSPAGTQEASNSLT